MLTKLEVRNFKRFENVSIELGSPVVFIGPNNSGKTTALQALALWDLGLKRWIEKRGEGETPGKRPGVAINRRDFVATPIPESNLLWRDLHVRDVRRANGKPDTDNIRIDVIVEGASDTRSWRCGLEFDYTNAESFYCRPLLDRSQKSAGKESERMPIPPESRDVRVAFLPPMSGLSDREFAKQPGEISFLIGQGRTAEVLRNLCLQVQISDVWANLHDSMEALFGISLIQPVFIPERAEITLAYKTRAGVTLDLSSSGRGVQQTLLLLAYLAVNPKSVLLLDEPDAHLEILRQRQIYRLLSEKAEEQGSQIIAASHSEVVLNEAADKDVVVSFVGQPHRVDDRGAQTLKALREIGFEQYYQAEITGWVLYLEGSTDLAILTAFARILDHPVQKLLAAPFVHYVENQPQKARDHFHGLKEAKPDLVGFLLCDRLEKSLQKTSESLAEHMWSRREIENYLCQPDTLLAFADDQARAQSGGPLFEPEQTKRAREAMQQSIRDLVPPIALENMQDPWWHNEKMSDAFLDRLFERFYTRLNLPNLMRKTNYHRLAPFVPREHIDGEIPSMLDRIQAQAAKARQRSAGL